MPEALAALALLIALPLRVLAAQHRGGLLDRAAMGFALIGAAIPNFRLGPRLNLVFSLWSWWRPSNSGIIRWSRGPCCSSA